MRLSFRIQAGLFFLAALAGCSPVTSTFGGTPAAQAADSAIVQAIAREAEIDPAEFPTTSVAVLPLRVESPDSTLQPLGYGLAELLMSDLARSQQVQVVDRIRIHALLRELALGRTEIVDTTRSPRLGRILGARSLVLGNISSTGPTDLLIVTRLARTEDATLRAVASGTTTLDEILEAEKEVALSVFPALGVTLTPAERAAIERRPTRSLGALLAFSRGVQAEAEAQFSMALREYREAVRLDAGFREPRERLNSLEVYFPDLAGVAALTIDGINRPGPPDLSDIANPAFRDRQGAILIIPITIR